MKTKEPKKYYWFASYLHKKGYGTIYLTTDTPYFHLEEAQRAVQRDEEASNVCIMNFFQITKKQYENL